MFLAHSAKKDKDGNVIVPAQCFKEHAQNVSAKAKEYVQEVFDEHHPHRDSLLKICDLYGPLHDLGKLYDLTQDKFNGNRNDIKKLVNHVDAGVFVCDEIKKWTNSELALLTGIMIHAHHVGISKALNDDTDLTFYNTFQDMNLSRYADNRNLADNYPAYGKKGDSKTVREYGADKLQSELLSKFTTMFNLNYLCNFEINEAFSVLQDLSPLDIRMFFSCLINADHYDTARHYGQSTEENSNKLKAQDRLDKLLGHIKSKQKSDLPEAEQLRQDLRNMLLEDNLNIEMKGGFYYMSALVGIGKTYSSLALALRLAEHFGLKRIFSVIPYSNIIVQAVDDFKNTITLQGENKHLIVGENHYRFDPFKQKNISSDDAALVNEYTNSWDCPITVTTSVQLFETLATNNLMRIKKLKNLHDSVIIIDEYHSSLPLELFRQALVWLKELVDKYNCHVIFMSGTMVETWNIDELKSVDISPINIVSEETEELMIGVEKDRLDIVAIEEKQSIDSFVDIVGKEEGPVICVCNTVANASIIYKAYANKYGEDKCEFLSSALSPNDQRRAIKKAKNRLSDKTDNDWVLFATSSVECGVDLSFRNGFREKQSAQSVSQTGGRVSRGSEFSDSKLYIFELDRANGITVNPEKLAATHVYERLFENVDYFYDLGCYTESIREEIKITLKDLKKNFEDNEKYYKFNKQSKEYKVIPEDTMSVLVDEDIFDELKGKKLSKSDRRKISMNSIQLRMSKFNKYNAVIEERDLNSKETIFVWVGEYDKNSIGYMAEELD